MAWVDGFSLKENVLRRNVDGKRSILFPTLAGLAEVEVFCAGCMGCSKRDTHRPCEEIGVEVPWGETRHQRVQGAEKLRRSDAINYHKALWLLSHCRGGTIDTIMFNAGLGTANNVSQSYTYEVIGIAGATVTVTGPNPRRLGTGLSVLNPEWPFDPDNGRLLNIPGECALPAGACVKFLAPSVLAERVIPVVVQVIPPATNAETATFDLVLSCDVENGMVPIDAAAPPWDGKYYLKVYWYQSFPEGWGNWQVPRETSFARKTVVLSGDTVRGLSGGIYELLDAAGESCRVLFPGMLEEGEEILVIVVDGGSYTVYTADQVGLLLETTQVARGSWQTTIDLSVWATPTLSSVTIVYRPEARSGDEPERVQVVAQCANCQNDPSGSYATEGTDLCTAAADATGWDRFKQECWQPVGAAGTGCDRFCLGHEGNAFLSGNLRRAPSDAQRSTYWADLWTRCSWVFVQGVPGFSGLLNFAVVRPMGGGPSIEEIYGSFQDDVPEGYFAGQIGFFGATAGMLEMVEDEDEHQSLRLRVGAFWLRGRADDPIDAWALRDGILPTEAGLNWSRPDPLGTADAVLEQVPIGCGVTGVYEFEHSGSWLGRRSHSVTLEGYVEGVVLSASEDDVTAQMRAMV